MKSKRKSKKVVIVILCLAIVLTIGGTIAYFTSQNEVKNTITMGKIDVEVIEKVTEEEKTNVGATVKAGSAPCWVRVCVTIPKDSNNNELFTCSPNQFDEESKWSHIDGSEFYYYKSVVDASKSTEPIDLILFDSIKPVTGLDPLLIPNSVDVIVYAEAVQFDPLGDPKQPKQTAQEAFANIKTNNQ